MTERWLSTQCVQQLASLDTSFSQENAEAIRDASEFPHSIMMLFAGHLARNFEGAKGRNQLIAEQEGVIAEILAVLEHFLQHENSDLQTVIMESFVEQIYDENSWLFDYILNKAGPLLHKQMLMHKVQRQNADPPVH